MNYWHGNKIGKAKKTLLDTLGDNWTLKEIDWEVCVYRDLGAYDVEISGVKNPHSRISIYVWQKAPYLRIIECHHDIHLGHNDIDRVCGDIVQRYSQDVNIHA